MEKKLSYDVWLQWSLTDCCNLRCTYCISGINKGIPVGSSSLKKFDIPALLKTLSATGKTFLIGFTGGGEPFIVPNLVEACIAITEHHYIQFNTNLTLPAVRRLAEQVNPEKIKHIIASCHTQELKKKNLLNTYIKHYHLFKNKGVNVVASEVGYPGLLPEVASLRKEFSDKGVNISFGPYIGEFEGKTYPAAYSDEEIELLGLERENLVNYYAGHHPCNAGYNVAAVTMDGNIQPCSRVVGPSLGNIYSGIKFNASMTICPYERCGCPFYYFDPGLFEKAKQENQLLITRFKSKNTKSLYFRLQMEKTKWQIFSHRVRNKVKRLLREYRQKIKG